MSGANFNITTNRVVDEGGGVIPYPGGVRLYDSFISSNFNVLDTAGNGFWNGTGGIAIPGASVSFTLDHKSAVLICFNGSTGTTSAPTNNAVVGYKINSGDFKVMMTFTHANTGTAINNACFMASEELASGSYTIALWGGTGQSTQNFYISQHILVQKFSVVVLGKVE